jgi:SAM-dependent methyltransferase
MLSFLRNNEVLFKLPVERLLQGSETDKMARQPDHPPRLANQELMPDPTMFPVALSDINAFTGEDFLTIQEKTLKYHDLTREEWRKKNPTTWEEKTAFYQQTSSYIYELTEWHRRDPINKLLLSTRAEGTALDYGCGTATLSLLGQIEGKSIHAYDIPSVTFEFAKSRLRRHGLECLICETPKREAYDTVICVDVLEHLQDPMQMLKDLKGLLKPGGLLIANAAGLPEFQHLHPMHEFVTNDDVERMVKQLGFTDIDRYHFNVVARK